MDFLNLNIIPPGEMDMVDIEAKLEDLFMASFRAIFKVDPKYPFQEDFDKTKIVITSVYPEKIDAPLKKPQVVFHNIGYSVSYNNSFKRNLSGSEFGDDGYNYTVKKVNVIPYSMTISVFAGKSESRNIANRIVNYFSVYDRLFQHLNLNIASASKSPTTPAGRFPEKIFETTIQIQGHTEWSSNFTIIDKNKEDVLTKEAYDTIVEGLKKGTLDY